MGEVVRFDPAAEIVGDGKVLNPDNVLENNKGSFTEVVVIGRDHDGKVIFASSHGRLEAMWLLRKGEHMLLSYGGE